MCGISGYYAKKENFASPLVRKMSLLLQHRGPDNLAFFDDHLLSLGHNRLSLIDIDKRSNQPFENSQHALVYNGEIYNFLSLKKLLENEGCNFTTTSDTEVLFVALQKWGIKKTLLSLEGMFAFGWYNKQSKRLIIARDKLGIKPLFYFNEPDGFAFASELKALIAVAKNKTLSQVRTLLVPLRPIENSSYLTPFENIFQLKPGHWIEIDEIGNCNEEIFFNNRDYVDEAYYNSLNNLSQSKAIDLADELLNNSVKRMLVADASIGAFVSGGVDSSLISAIASKHKSVNLYTANIIGKYSEFPYAQQLAKHINAPLYQFDFTPEMFINSLAKTTWHYESPIILHPNSVPFGHVANLAMGNNEKAVLTGEGSDELFLGYPAPAFHRYSKYLMWPYTSLQKAYKKIPGLSKYIAINKTNWVSELIAQVNGFDTKMAETKNAYKFKFIDSQQSRQEQTLTLDMLQNHLHTLLWRNDRVGMMNSIESRFPYIEDELVKFGINLPVKFKLMQTTKFYNLKHPFILDKGIIRKVAERYLPDSLVNKKKIGFPVHGLSNCEIKKEFFLNGFWQEFTGMNNTQLDFMYSHTSPGLISKIAAAEIWGQLFIRETNQEILQEKINANIFMTLK